MLLSSAWEPTAVLGPTSKPCNGGQNTPDGVGLECKSTDGCIRVGRVVEERLVTDGRVVEACGVAKERTNTVYMLELPVVLLKSA